MSHVTCSANDLLIGFIECTQKCIQEGEKCLSICQRGILLEAAPLALKMQQDIDKAREQGEWMTTYVLWPVIGISVGLALGALIALMYLAIRDCLYPRKPQTPKPTVEVLHCLKCDTLARFTELTVVKTENDTTPLIKE